MLQKSDTRDAYWCVVSGTELWTIDGNLPFGSASQWKLPIDQAIQISTYNDHPIYWLNDSEIGQELPMTSLRELLCVEETLFFAASKAVQYGMMTQTIRFCPQCGGRNHFNHQDIAMQCNDCRKIHYPRIFPCIIVAIRKDNQILLAQHPRHKSGMYTVIAGFVEAGETLEQCVAREVKEETGLNVKNIRYFGSQPWAFSTSMMAAFLADYDSGEINPDYTELSDAAWFSPDQLPELAPQGTIARRLIEQTVHDIKTDTK